MEGLRQFLVARGDRPVLLKAVDQPFDLVALAIGGAIEMAGPTLVGLARDNRADPPTAQLAPRQPLL